VLEPFHRGRHVRESAFKAPDSDCTSVVGSSKGGVNAGGIVMGHPLKASRCRLPAKRVVGGPYRGKKAAARIESNLKLARE
jgi:hypothetical protein